MPRDWIFALLGGGLIGVAVTIMLLFNGRVTGISGIISGALRPVRGDVLWRLLFILGLFIGGLVMSFVDPDVFSGQVNVGFVGYIAAGLLVGFGTVMGSGCTSGHGVCGISRWSPRSILATVVFMLSGIAAVFIFSKLGVYP